MPDSIRPKTLQALGLTYAPINFDSSSFYLELASKYALEEHDSLTYARSLNSLGVAYFYISEFDISNSFYKRAVKVFSTLERSKSEALVYNNIGINYQNKGQYDSAKFYYRKSLDLKTSDPEKIDSLSISYSYHSLGVLFLDEGKYDSALVSFKRVMDIRRRINSPPQLLAEVATNFGIIFTKYGNYSLALEYYLEALSIYESIDNMIDKAKVLKNLGDLFSLQNNFSKALNYHQQALSVREKLGDQAGLATSYLAIAIINNSQGKKEEARRNAWVSLKKERLLGRTCKQVECLDVLTSISLEDGQIDSAQIFIDQAVGLVEECNSLTLETIIDFNKAKLAVKKEGFAKAVKGFKKVYDVSSANDYYDLQKESAKHLFEAYKQIGDENKALKYHEIYHQIY
ncbi:MAG: tetratricopeptide repeat protein, partial [Bacteroidota bacterium]